MISVIVPVYNVEKYLQQCIESIIKQNVEEIEILLIDDGSTDSSGKICDRYKCQDERIRVFHTDNHGLSGARNIGLKEARGEFVAFVDSDDWIEPDMYSALLKRIEETKADISAGSWFYEYPDKRIKGKGNDIVYTGDEALKALIREELSNNVWSKLYRKSLFENIFFKEGRNYEDVAIMHSLIGGAQKVSTIEKNLYHYRMRNESITKKMTAQNLLDYGYSYIDRYKYLKVYKSNVFNEMHPVVLQNMAKGISKIWRWWYSCSHEERVKNASEIRKFRNFSRKSFSKFGYSFWPIHLRISSFFMKSDSMLSFASIYFLNRLFRIVRPDRANKV